MENINTPKHEEDIRVKYDAICYNIFLGVATETKGAKRICFSGFDAKNKEHLAVLAVTAACISLLGSRNIAVDCNAWDRLRLARQYKKTVSIGDIKKSDSITLNIDGFLDNMRGWAEELCGKEFTFEDIYREYYEERK